MFFSFVHLQTPCDHCGKIIQTSPEGKASLEKLLHIPEDLDRYCNFKCFQSKLQANSNKSNNSNSKKDKSKDSSFQTDNEKTNDKKRPGDGRQSSTTTTNRSNKSTSSAHNATGELENSTCSQDSGTLSMENSTSNTAGENGSTTDSQNSAQQPIVVASGSPAGLFSAYQKKNSRRSQHYEIFGYFSWEGYLREEGSTPAPTECFKQHSEPPTNEFELNMKLEATDPRNPTSTCIASVVSIMGARIHLRLDGSDNTNDFWELIDSQSIKPIGYTERNGGMLQPPLGFRKNPAHWPIFVTNTLSGALIAPESCFKPTPRAPRTNLFREGMKLEAVDRKNPRLICPATIQQVKDDMVFVSFDGWKGAFDYWCRYDSRDLFPVGWCQKSNHPLQMPGNKDLKISESNLSYVMPTKIPLQTINKTPGRAGSLLPLKPATATSPVNGTTETKEIKENQVQKPAQTTPEMKSPSIPKPTQETQTKQLQNNNGNNGQSPTNSNVVLRRTGSVVKETEHKVINESKLQNTIPRSLPSSSFSSASSTITSSCSINTTPTSHPITHITKNTTKTNAQTFEVINGHISNGKTVNLGGIPVLVTSASTSAFVTSTASTSSSVAPISPSQKIIVKTLPSSTQSQPPQHPYQQSPQSPSARPVSLLERPRTNVASCSGGREARFPLITVYVNNDCFGGPHLKTELLNSIPKQFGPTTLNKTMQDVIQTLIDCSKDKKYTFGLLRSGHGSFSVSGMVDNQMMRMTLPHFNRSIAFWNYLSNVLGGLYCCVNFIAPLELQGNCTSCNGFSVLPMKLINGNRMPPSPVSNSISVPTPSISSCTATYSKSQDRPTCSTVQNVNKVKDQSASPKLVTGLKRSYPSSYPPPTTTTFEIQKKDKSLIEKVPKLKDPVNGAAVVKPEETTPPVCSSSVSSTPSPLDWSIDDVIRYLVLNDSTLDFAELFRIHVSIYFTFAFRTQNNQHLF